LQSLKIFFIFLLVWPKCVSQIFNPWWGTK
jgi:hypothetical protein